MIKSFLTPEQRVAIDVLDRPMALTAGAGSGKTTVLVQRYLALLKTGLEPKNILAVTFTNEAAEELRERILAHLKSEEASTETLLDLENTPYIGTIHSFCYLVLEQFGSVLNLPLIESITSPFEIASRFDLAYRIWLETLEEKTLSGLLHYFSHQELRATAKHLFHNHFVLRQSLERSNGDDFGRKIVRRLYDVLKPLFYQIENELHRKGQYTFNDLETLALRIFTESHVARQRLQDQFKSILIDEFQDTSRLQWNILQNLLGNNWKKLFIVGDPKQSIYGFRHADVSLFRLVSEEVSNRAGLLHELNTNFRTQRSLLASLNEMTQRLFEDFPVSPMQHGREGDGHPVQVKYFETTLENTRSQTQELELAAIVQEVKTLIDSGTQPCDIAVLFRVSDRMEDYLLALRERGIAGKAKKTVGLFQHYDVIDILGFLKAIENPLDNFTLAAFLRSTFVGYTYEQLWRLSQDRAPLYENLLKDNPPDLHWFFSLVEQGEMRVDVLLTALFSHTGYWPGFEEGYLSILEPLSVPGLTVHEAVKEMLTWEKEGLFIEMQDAEVENAVSLMTVHGAKGLEFSHVILADTLRQSPHNTKTVLVHPEKAPGVRYRSEDEIVASADYKKLQDLMRKNDQEEAKRILYVALTRARESLTVFLPKGMKTVPKGSWADLLGNVLQPL